MTVSAGSSTTKTAITEVTSTNYTLNWTAGDAIACYEVSVVESVPTVQGKVTSSALTADAETASFTFDLSGNNGGPDYSYIFVYPAAKYTKSSNTYRAQIPENQTFSANTFDKDADVLISRAITGQAARPTTVEAQFERIGATALMNIKAPSTSTTEKIRKITFSTTESGAKLYGYIKVDPLAGTHETEIYNGGNSLTLTPASSTNYTGTIPVWFRLGEATLTDNFTVVVTTDKKIYTKVVDLAGAGRFIEFHNSGLTKFNVDMTGVAGVVNPSFEGDYLIGSYSGGKWHLMSSVVNSNNYYERYETTVAGEFGSVSASDFIAAGISTNDYCWKVEEDANGYSIKSYKTGKYVSLTKDSNNAYAADPLDDNTYFTFSVNGNITTITSTKFDNRYLRYNTQSPRFAFYTSSGSNIYLIPCDYDNRTTVTLTFTESSLSYDTSDYNTCSGQTATANPNVAAITNNITYALTGNNIGSVDASSGAVTLNGTQGSATITASFAGDSNYMPAQNSYTITVSSGDASDYTTTWTASSGALGSGIGSGTINTTTTGSTDTQEWSYTRSLVSGASYTGWSSNCVQLGKNGGVENLTLTTSNIPGTIKSVSVECSSYQGKHNISISVGGTTYLSSTGTASWTTVDAKSGEGTSSGAITISFTGGSRALYIKSITVVYNN